MGAPAGSQTRWLFFSESATDGRDLKPHKIRLTSGDLHTGCQPAAVKTANSPPRSGFCTAGDDYPESLKYSTYPNTDIHYSQIPERMN
jgi:hypothetical protein